MRVVTVTDETRGTVIGNRIEVAETSLTRMVGLLGRRGLNAGEGLWIRPSSGVHTFFMRFSIDVIGLDKEMKVVKLWRRLVPYRVTSVSMTLSSVIELGPGAIDVCHVQIGDRLTIASGASTQG
jgi:uncharacterized membrane protein (UPF0127 family)